MWSWTKIKTIYSKFSPKDRAIAIICIFALIIGIIWGIFSFIGAVTELKPKPGGKIIYGTWEQPHFINPVLSQNNETDNDLMNLIYDGLIAIDQRGKIINDLASEINISKDGKTYEVILKENILWHDGTPFTADDVIFTIEAIQNARYNSPWYNIWRDIKIEKIGDYMVRFYLNTPQNQFLQHLSFKIMPAHIWANISPTQWPLTDYNLKAIGTGPYCYEKLEKSKEGSIIAYHLKKNPKYFKHIPYIQNITFSFYETQDDAFEALIQGKINLIREISYYQKELIKNKNKLIIKRIVLPRYYGVFFNQKHNLLSNKNVVKALELSLDKQKIIDTVFYQEAELLNAPISKNFIGHSQSLNQLSYNPEEAKNILKNLGFEDYNNDKILEKKDNNSSAEFTLTVPLVDELMNVANIAKQNWEAIGVKVNINPVSLQNIYQDSLKLRNYDAIIFGEAYGIIPNLFYFWHSSQITAPGLNISMYSNSEIDKLLEQSSQTQSQETLEQNLIKIQELLTRDKPAIFLCNPYFLYAQSYKIKGNNITTVNMPSNKFENIEDWYINTRRVLK